MINLAASMGKHIPSVQVGTQDSDNEGKPVKELRKKFKLSSTNMDCTPITEGNTKQRLLIAPFPVQLRTDEASSKCISC